MDGRVRTCAGKRLDWCWFLLIRAYKFGVHYMNHPRLARTEEEEKDIQIFLSRLIQDDERVLRDYDSFLRSIPRS